MLKLNAAYSKKVPSEGEYTSQSYHASIEVELPDGLSQEQLNDKITEYAEYIKLFIIALVIIAIGWFVVKALLKKKN